MINWIYNNSYFQTRMMGNKLNGILIFLLIMGLLVSCRDKQKELPETLIPVTIALEDYFPYYENVVSRQNLHLVVDSCPYFSPDSSSISLAIGLDSVKTSEVACFVVSLSKTISVQDIDKPKRHSDGSMPIRTITKQLLFMEYYQPKSEVWLITIPNLVYESGDYELVYGIFLKKDSLAKKLPYYKVECLYSAED